MNINEFQQKVNLLEMKKEEDVKKFKNSLAAVKNLSWLPQISRKNRICPSVLKQRENT